MAAHKLILIETLCLNYQVEFSFFKTLNKEGLIRILTIEQQQFIHQDEIGNLEKIIRLHDELHINIEGIDCVINLLQKLDHLKEELNDVKNRLRLYESD
ncbi:MAG: chaperone modulator CbpM [Flavobacteriaceae bacterium]|nr:chaperone modulator CbpM [Flavobacteriaceae bacterium]